MGTEGWYNDEADPAIARWYDGTGWTSHTMVKAEWAGPGEPPPPGSEAWFVDGPDVDRHDPALYATVPRIDTDDQPPAEAASARTATITAPPVVAPAPFDHEVGDYDEDVEMWGARPVGAHFASHDPVFDPGDDHEYGDYPVARPGIDWGRFGAPLAGVAALVVALLAFSLVKDDGGGPDGPVESASSVSAIDGAVERARQGLAVDVTDGDLKALIRGLCDVAAGGPVAPVAGDAAIAVDDPSQLTGLMSAAARGAADYCPGSTAASNGAVDDVVAAAGLQITTTTVAPVETTQVASTAGNASSGSSKKGSASASSGTARSSSNGGVIRTESRSQSSTNPTGLTGSAGSSQDQVDVGNIGNNRQVVDTVVTTPPTEAPPDTTDTSAP